MLKIVERSERMLDRGWLEDRNALLFLEAIDPTVMRDERRLYYRIFEVFSRESVVPDATVLCLDHGFMLEVITMARSVDAQLHTLAEDLMRAADRTYISHQTRDEGDEYVSMGFHCSTVNYRISNPKPVQPDVDFCADLSATFDTREEFMEWIRGIYGQSSVYSILATGGRMIVYRDGDHPLMTVLSHHGKRWVVGKMFDAISTVHTCTRAEFSTIMQCILSSLPEGDDVVYTYHQYAGGVEALWLIEHGWLPDSYLYARSLNPTGVTNAN